MVLVQLATAAAAAAMEVNRDEAERCIDIATAALKNEQPEKAQRFLEKAQRLFPTEKAKGKLKWPSPRTLQRVGGQHPHRLELHHLHPGRAMLQTPVHQAVTPSVAESAILATQVWSKYIHFNCIFGNLLLRKILLFLSI